MQPKVRARQISRRKRLGAEIEHVALAADHGIGEIDFDLGAETRRHAGAIRRSESPIATCTGFSTWMKRRGAGLRDNAGLIDRGDESGRAAVHDRNFRAVDFDGGVVDAHAAQGCEHVFGGRNQRTVTVAQHGGEFGRDDGFGDAPELRGRNHQVRCGQK